MVDMSLVFGTVWVREMREYLFCIKQSLSIFFSLFFRPFRNTSELMIMAFGNLYYFSFNTRLLSLTDSFQRYRPNCSCLLSIIIMVCHIIIILLIIKHSIWLFRFSFVNQTSNQIKLFSFLILFFALWTFFDSIRCDFFVNQSFSNFVFYVGEWKYVCIRYKFSFFYCFCAFENDISIHCFFFSLFFCVIFIPTGFSQRKSNFDNWMWISIGMVFGTSSWWAWIYYFCWIYKTYWLLRCWFIERRIIRANKNLTTWCYFRDTGKFPMNEQ